LFRFLLAERLAFKFALSLAFFGFFFGLLSFEFAARLAFVFSDFLSFAVFAFVVDSLEVSPSFAGRLISTATVCPTLTILPASGTWIITVSGFASLLGRMARTRKFKPAELIVLSAVMRSLPTMSGTFVSELRSERTIAPINPMEKATAIPMTMKIRFS